MSDNGILLDIKGLCVSFFTEDGVARAVQDVSFSVKKGETFALVGESGCGKSVTALSVMRLIADPPGKIVAGEINFDGRNLLELSEQRMRAVRGNRIAMIFQEPMTSLNPVYTVGEQIVEAIRLHQKKDRSRGLGYLPLKCCEKSAYPTPPSELTNTRTRCQAECGSG